MSKYLNEIWNTCTSWISNVTDSAIGNGLVFAGTKLETIASILIVVGMLLWIFRNTKVFRYGLISYFIGLLIELIGLAMIK